MDSQTINVMAATAIGFLSPYLAKAGEATAKKIGEDIYQVLKAHFDKKPAAQEALTDLEKSPNDSDFQAALRVQLKKILAEDEVLVIQLRRLLQAAEETKAGTIIIKQVAGDNAKQFGQVFGNITFDRD